MEAKETIQEILRYYDINANQLAKAIGFNRPQVIYDILSGKTKSITDSMAYKICGAFPEISKDWLRTGKGSMFIFREGNDKSLTANARFNIAVGYLINSRKIYNKSELSNTLEVQRSFISEIAAGKRTLTEQFAERFTETFSQISKDWLLTGDGQMMTTPESNTDLIKRIEELADSEGITIGALERTIGSSKGVISGAIRKETDIQSKWICKIAEKYPQYSATWLLTGKGPMLNKKHAPQLEDMSSIEDKIDRIVGFIERIESSFNK